MPALLCVSIMVHDEASAHADMRSARDAGADILELRIDEVFTGAKSSVGELDHAELASIRRLIAQSPLPLIVTCRSASEGGHYDGDETARVALYEALGLDAHPPKYLDFEHAIYSHSANLRQKVNLAVGEPGGGGGHHRDVRSGLILSMHDFQGRPSDLIRRVAAMQDEPVARVVKFAITARSLRDNLELFDLLSENPGVPMIALAMGRFGLMSRVLASKFGGFLTFASLRPTSATAPGQPTVRELVDTFRFRSIGRRTRVLGLIGWPVEHSLSPLIHNAGFDAIAPERSARAETGAPSPHDAVYLPLPVPPEYEHFKATLSVLIDHQRLDFAGCSVTIPHKQHLVRFALERMRGESGSEGDDTSWSMDDLSRIAGAANTLVIDRDAAGNARSARVLNTDAPAAVECLSAALDARQPGSGLSGRRVALFGAGGVARAIAVGLVQAGASVTLCNRTLANAERLVDDLCSAGLVIAAGQSFQALGMDEVVGAHPDAIVNCSPMGMSAGPAPDASPLSASDLAALPVTTIVMDTVYNPVRTPLLKLARARGLVTIDGVEMFVRQAALQFSLWTGQAAPAGLFRRICDETLGV